MSTPDSFRLGTDGMYRCEAFQSFVWQEHAFGTRANNPAADITLRQIHSNHVVNAKAVSDREYEGDALISTEIGKSIGIRTADCVPILLLDERNRAIAAVHAGWRGTVAEIARCTVERMAGEFRTSPADLYAAIGPCVRSCCYEVGPDVADRFTSYFPDWKPVKGSRKLDLAEANRCQMERAGIASARIFDCGLCTACLTDRFFSYRRQPQTTSRMITAICRLA